MVTTNIRVGMSYLTEIRKKQATARFSLISVSAPRNAGREMRRFVEEVCRSSLLYVPHVSSEPVNHGSMVVVKEFKPWINFWGGHHPQRTDVEAR